MKTYDQLLAGSFIFSADGQRYAYFAVRKGRIVVVCDSAEGLDFEDVRLARFSPDGKTLAYLGKHDGRVYAVINGKESAGYASCGSLTFSAKGQIAYSAERNGEAFVVRDGVEGRHYEGIVADTMTFSPDGAHLAYEARGKDNSMLVIDGAETGDIGGTLRGSRLIFDGPDVLRALLLHKSDVYRAEMRVGH